MSNIDEIAALLDISVKAVYNRISKLGLKSTKRVNRKKMYNNKQVDQIKSLSKDVVIKYYAAIKTETWYIYESKMN